jgi:hypothetical protein
MPVAEISSGGNGVAFLVSAGIVYEIIAAACSSPQTAEINAAKRSATLMKWVHLGTVQAVLFVGLAAYFDPKRKKPIIWGGSLAGVIMYGCYFYANKSGLASDQPGTEDY